MQYIYRNATRVITLMLICAASISALRSSTVVPFESGFNFGLHSASSGAPDILDHSFYHFGGLITIELTTYRYAPQSPGARFTLKREPSTLITTCPSTDWPSGNIMIQDPSVTRQWDLPAGTYSFSGVAVGGMGQSQATGCVYYTSDDPSNVWDLFDEVVDDWYVAEDWSPAPSTVASGHSFTQTRVWRQDRRKGEICTAGPSQGLERNIEYYSVNNSESRQMIGTGIFHSLFIDSGDGQSANPGSIISNFIKVRVIVNGNPAINESVTFTVTHGGGSIVLTDETVAGSTTTVTTDAHGNAYIRYKQPNASGVRSEIKAESGGKVVMIHSYSNVPAPKNFRASSSYGAISLYWDHIPGTDHQYELERANSNSPGTYVYVGTTSIRDWWIDESEDLEPGTYYTYRIRASAGMWKGPSDWVEATVYHY